MERARAAHFWSGTQQQFVDYVLKPGFEAVRAADPAALVLGPDSGNDDWLDAIFKAGGGQYLDVITVHVYACCDNTDDVKKVLLRLDCTGGWPWDKCRKKAIDNNGLSGKPVWLTEVGWKTQAAEWEQKQAAYYAQLLDEMRKRSSWWKKTIFYEIWDADACDPGMDNCWGIIRPDWSRKPAFDAVKQYIAAHQPRAEAGPDIDAVAGVPAQFDGSGSKDPDGQITKHRWDFDRSDGVTEQAQGAKVSRAFAPAGTYVVTLVVTDNDGIEDADTVTVHVGPAGQDAGSDSSDTSYPSDASFDAARDAATDEGPMDVGKEDAGAATGDGGNPFDSGPDSSDASDPSDLSADGATGDEGTNDAETETGTDAGTKGQRTTDARSTADTERADHATTGGCSCASVGAGPPADAAKAVAPDAGVRPECARIVEDIAREIERLKPEHPKLEKFSVAEAVRPARCEISYSHKTHRSTTRAGWTAGFPEPDPDGIAFYVHLYNKEEQAGQIDTQPVMPPWHIGEWKVTFLVREGEKAPRAADLIHNRLAFLGMRVKGEKRAGKPKESVVSRAESGSEIVVEGTARDAKMGAVVVMEDGGVYFIKGLDAWPPDIHGKKVVVLGRPGRADFPVVKPPAPGEPAMQGFEGQPDWLANARWRLLQ
ncbi:MAG: PKD domain-containing protein [Deltaproteobacteria bacterium]|nr:PKD domain-containing protein [Deltaproteobacteria bacterium]